MKKLLILGASAMQIPVIEEARRLGHQVLVADFDQNAPGLSLADIPLVISTNDSEAVLAVAKEQAVDGVLTTSDYPVRTVAHVCGGMNLPGLSKRAAEICTDKFLQRELLRFIGQPVPEYILLEDATQLRHVKKKPIKFPVIVKPVDSSASRGVSRVDRECELHEACALATKYSRSGKVLIEEFVMGPEYSVEVLVQGGYINIVAITEKTTGGDSERFFVETRHVIPANLDQEVEQSVAQAVHAAISAAGLNDCASHPEVKLTPRGPMIIEMAARLGGDYITSDLVPLATGVNMLENVIRIALGEPIAIRPNRTRFAGVQFVTPDSYARAEQHFCRLANHPNIHRMDLRFGTGGSSLRSSLDRLGYCIASAETRKELCDLLRF